MKMNLRNKGMDLHLHLSFSFSSHWFLAVICFPGLQAPAQFSYIPKLTKPVTQKTLIAQIVSNLAAKSTETGAPIKSGETGKEPVNSLKGYKIPKVAKSGEEAQSESESNNSEGMSVNDEGNEKDNGERLDEPMETEEKDLSEAQVRGKLIMEPIDRDKYMEFLC